MRHGETESLDDLFYLNCPYGENIVMPYASVHFIGTRNSNTRDTVSALGMIADKERNGGALLVWYEKTSRGS